MHVWTMWFLKNNIMTLLTIIIMLMTLSFITLFERNLLGMIQYRKGPNKNFFKGLFQPFNDAIKLFSKENLILSKINYMMYFISPLMMFTLALLLWLTLPIVLYYWSSTLIMMLIFCIMSMSSYGLMLSGWSSNSMYSMIGCTRMMSLMLSYEVVLILITFNIFLMTESLSLKHFSKSFIFIFWSLAMIFLIIMLCELNRTPSDLSEGESELVSGFNTEYFSSGFTLIFMAEYSNIIFMSFLFNYLFLGYQLNSLISLFMVFMTSLWVIWMRGTNPRIRYDLLMIETWTDMLPSTLLFMFITMFYKLNQMMIYIL
uniref:NADH-ubiquinone oxidoreductase chain 1 n=1 Tax=Megalyra sp. MM-2014 TaxID=1503221 RepID=A0A096XL95_9HYME|nr:NADH dehydrogenase subunit 1 [Megalyra sp. MM-2014]